MDKINDGGSAFPYTDKYGDIPMTGMTLRDYFAAHCPDMADEEPKIFADAYDVELPDIKASHKCWSKFWLTVEVKKRYAYADAMLKARENKS